MQQKLSEVISLKRRYNRSINLERDLTLVESVLGYIPTSWARDTSERILQALISNNTVRAWTITGVYGTGKSAFAHFLSALVAPKTDPIYQNAQSILEQSLGVHHPLIAHIIDQLPEKGLIRAVATAQREPLGYTIVRALHRGCEQVGSHNPEQQPLTHIFQHLEELMEEDQKIPNQEILQCIQQIAQETQSGILLIIDELGKGLEYAAWHQDSDDLYLLQQLAELPSDEHTPTIAVLGLLHQSFADYARDLTKTQRNEWSKIQGRFEDIPFTATNDHMLHLLSQAIDHSHTSDLLPFLNTWATTWQKTLHSHDIHQERLSVQEFSNIYPLHPLAALTLPILCSRYAQNDRSLFTFLTSQEPHSFTSFLQETPVQGIQPTTLKLHRIYDYFVEAASVSHSAKASTQRWTEIQGRITDAQHLEVDQLLVLKTIGILNLVDTVGTLRATQHLVVLALSEDPNDPQETQRWLQAIEQLIKRGLVTHRKQLDELRIWEGSDFDIDQATTAAMEKEQSSLATLLTQAYPLTPIIAQRHSYITGTLRYFERRYISDYKDLAQILPENPDSDGVIAYWLSEQLPTQCPTATTAGKPFVLLASKNIEKLAAVSREVSALATVDTTAPQLQSDGVARREVRQRLTQTRRLLIDLLEQSFLTGKEDTACISNGTNIHLRTLKDFQKHLSALCDEVYPNTPVLWNELINRREITSQGAKARRELLEAMLRNSHLERLGLEGNGPESSIYLSLLNNSGIHRYLDEQWGFAQPRDKSIGYIWEAIEHFCLNARTKPETLDRLYTILEAPPYGMKKGSIPLFLAAVLLYHKDTVSVYQDGTFIPLLGAEHFELLVKQPGRFAVKHFEVAGLRTQVFQELALLLRRPLSSANSSTRNNTILSVVKPLIQFGNSLPSYTVKTKQLSTEAIAIRDAIRDAREPDELLFTILPQACGLEPISTHEMQDDTQVQQLKKILVGSLQELQLAYDRLLEKCKYLLYNTFTVRSDISKIREDLRVRAQYLKDNCIERQMRSFLFAAINDAANEREWLEALLMVVADKPVVSWNDDDVTRFEIRLSDLARRFIHLEAIKKEVYQQTPAGFEARRITVTQPDGYESNHIVWLNHEHQDNIQKLVEKVLQDDLVKDNEQLQQELVAALVEKVYQSTTQQHSLQRAAQKGKEA
ncbi:hypothetical protein KDW_39110 [Dictyobacter vulcani]|uniref:ATP-binding protein n=1 Tax=Dictyobacter vulcani TaxID=2607529 RepID=A0A5J4KUK3_9CHLR|nr:hypothetical protein [Dictyobacter vulcani]GER89749.1 hypothetical protein KDW_39110 [Dictyobacter vulcani]